MNTILKEASCSIKKFFGITFAMYTCISYALMLLNILTLNAEAPQWSGVALLFSHVLLFSALTALVFVLVGLLKKLNSALGHVIKFLLTYGAFYLCFFALQRGEAQPINVVTMSAVFTVIYAITVGISGAVGAIAARKANRESEYVSVYSEVTSESEEQ